MALKVVLLMTALVASSALTATPALADLLFLGPDIVRDDDHENVTRLMRLRAGTSERGFTVATGVATAAERWPEAEARSGSPLPRASRH